MYTKTDKCISTKPHKIWRDFALICWWNLIIFYTPSNRENKVDTVGTLSQKHEWRKMGYREQKEIVYHVLREKWYNESDLISCNLYKSSLNPKSLICMKNSFVLLEQLNVDALATIYIYIYINSWIIWRISKNFPLQFCMLVGSWCNETPLV